jgi:hypothetical protein
VRSTWLATRAALNTVRSLMRDFGIVIPARSGGALVPRARIPCWAGARPLQPGGRRYDCGPMPGTAAGPPRADVTPRTPLWIYRRA